MKINLVRIDDRLIHGQVATVWSKEANAQRIIICSDEVAKDQIRKTLLLQVGPPGVKVSVVDVAKAVRVYNNPKYEKDTVFFLYTCPPEGVQTLLNSIPKVVTGGLTVAGGMIVVVGYAMVLNMMGAKYLMPFFFLGFVIAAFTEFNLVAFGIMGAVFAIVYVQLNPKFQTPVAAPVTAGAGGSDDLDDDLDDELD